jgi:hypothetical protein
VALSRRQKHDLAWVVWNRVGNLAEFWEEYQAQDDGLAGIEWEEMRKQLAIWLSRLPGDTYDERIGLPERHGAPPRLSRKQQRELGLVAKNLAFDILDVLDEMRKDIDELQGIAREDLETLLIRWTKHIPSPE